VGTSERPREKQRETERGRETAKDREAACPESLSSCHTHTQDLQFVCVSRSRVAYVYGDLIMNTCIIAISTMLCHLLIYMYVCVYIYT